MQVLIQTLKSFPIQLDHLLFYIVVRVDISALLVNFQFLNRSAIPFLLLSQVKAGLELKLCF